MGLATMRRQVLGKDRGWASSDAQRQVRIGSQVEGGRAVIVNQMSATETVLKWVDGVG